MGVAGSDTERVAGPEEKGSAMPSGDDTASSSSAPGKPTDTEAAPARQQGDSEEEAGAGTDASPAPAPGPGPTPAPEEARTGLQTAAIIAALASALFLAALDVTIVTVAVPTIAQQFGSTAGYTWIGSAYMLATAAAAPVWGKLSDIWGRKPLMLLAVAVFWLGSLLSAVSVGMGMLIAARAVQGVGGGGIVILVNICISDLFSMRKRGIYFGAMGMVWAVASAVGPVLGGVFTSKVTWRWCFYINLPISGVGMVVLALVLKLHNPRTPVRQGLAAVDWLGSLTVVGATIMFLLGLELGGVTHPWGSPTVVCLLVFGLAAAGLFVAVEWRLAEYPLVPLYLFARRASAASLAVGALHGTVFISGSYYLPLYFQAVLGASPLMSGVYILPWVMSLSLTSAATGVVIKKTGRYLPCIVGGMALMTLGFGLFVALEPRPNWAKIVLFQLVAGTGVGPNFQAPLIALQTTVEPRDMAAATGTFAFIRQLFTSVSIVIGSVVFQNGMERQQGRLAAEVGPEAARLLIVSNIKWHHPLKKSYPSVPRLKSVSSLPRKACRAVDEKLLSISSLPFLRQPQPQPQKNLPFLMHVQRQSVGPRSPHFQ
ncbi:hypothetical protein VTH06DRAFT_4788 [Thermothelomyces fergusii]